MSLNPKRLQRWNKFFPNPEDAVIIAKYEKYIDKALKKDKKATLHEFFLEQYLKVKGWFGHHAKILEDGERLLYNYIEFVKISLGGKVFLKDLKQKFDELDLKYLRMILRITDKNSYNLLPDWYLAPQPLSFENGDLKKLGLLPEQRLLKRLLKRHKIKRQSPTFGTPAIQEYRKFRTGAVTGEKMVPIKIKRHKSSGGRRSKRKKRRRRRKKRRKSRKKRRRKRQRTRKRRGGGWEKAIMRPAGGWKNLPSGRIKILHTGFPRSLGSFEGKFKLVLWPREFTTNDKTLYFKLDGWPLFKWSAAENKISQIQIWDGEEEGGGSAAAAPSPGGTADKVHPGFGTWPYSNRAEQTGGHWTRKKRGDPIFRHHAHPTINVSHDLFA